MSKPSTDIWDKIDYQHDAVLQASAGTGKTYALEHIVLKLVQEKKVEDATQILLVTFTEKAAGELRDRVRKILMDNKDAKGNALLPPDFDAMTIGTIHSFCKQLLTEHAFENGAPMRLEVTTADKALLREAALTVIHSTGFAKRYGENLWDWLNLLKCNSLEVLVKATTRGVTMGPEPAATPVATMTAPGDSLRLLFAHAAALWDSLPPLPPAPDAIIDWLLKLSLPNGSINGQDVGASGRNYAAVGVFLEALKTEPSAVYASFLACQKGWKSTQEKFLNPRFNKQPKGAPNRLLELPQTDATLSEFITAFQDGMAQAADALEAASAAVLRDITATVAAEYERRKDAAGVMTFDDMVLRAEAVILAEAKDKAHHPLIDAIRRRYRFALVDEFQDTDAHQWNIFRALFSSAERPDGALLVVGDPKQAIYGFRGADVNAYLQAREAITQDDHKTLHQLDTTYRSTESMTEVFNRLFAAEGWFDDGAITYEPVSWGEKFRSAPEFSPLVLLESLPTGATPNSKDGMGNKSSCLPVFARNAADEILRLKGRVPGQEKKDGQYQDAPLDFGDFCFLVRATQDAVPIKRALAKRNIPYSHYKEAGLYTSAEGESVRAAFDFLAAPHKDGNLDALLLTPFFGVAPRDLQTAAATLGQGFWGQIGEWQQLATAHDWPGLFAAMLHASAAARRQPHDPEYDRRVAALRQIFDDLLFRPDKPMLDVGDFSTLLREWAAEEQVDREAGVRQKESDGQHVQIMTMHAAKGLEFPVVFVAAGMSELGDDAPEEQKRLFYVALTRAKFRLYLPWTARGDGRGLGSAGSALRLPKDAEKQAANPDAGFLARAVQSWQERWRQDHPKDPAARQVVDGKPQNDWTLDGTTAKATKSAQGTDAQPAPATAAARPAAQDADAIAEAATVVQEVARGAFRYNSFSSLRRALEGRGRPTPDDAPAVATPADPAATPRLIDQREADEAPDDAEEDSAPAAAASGKSLLPRGALSGDVFHTIMERLCRNPDGDDARPGFAEAADDTNEAAQESLLKLIAAIRGGFGLSNQEANGASTDLTLARLVRHALNAKLGAGAFRLRDIPRADRRAEIRFVAGEGLLAPGCALPEGAGAFNGSIDLAFRCHGEYYLLDWKTNTLADYGEDAMRAVYDAEYRLQGQLYAAAAQEWLGQAPSKVIYFFVRAAERPGNGDGVLTLDRENAGPAIAAALATRADGYVARLSAQAARRRAEQQPRAALKDDNHA